MALGANMRPFDVRHPSRSASLKKAVNAIYRFPVKTVSLFLAVPQTFFPPSCSYFDVCVQTKSLEFDPNAPQDSIKAGFGSFEGTQKICRRGLQERVRYASEPRRERLDASPDIDG